MKKTNLRLMLLFMCIICCITSVQAQTEVKTVKEAMKLIQYSQPPYRDAKFTPFPTLELFPPVVKGISDKLYLDMQSQTYIHANDRADDLAPSLYLKVKVPGTEYDLGVITFGGATDHELSRIFVADKEGNLKSCIDAAVSLGNVYSKQFQITADCKLIIYQLVPTTTKLVLFTDFMGDENKTVQCYRLDTTYSIDKNGQFVKEGEKKYPVKTYTSKQLYDKNNWEL